MYLCITLIFAAFVLLVNDNNFAATGWRSVTSYACTPYGVSVHITSSVPEARPECNHQR